MMLLKIKPGTQITINDAKCVVQETNMYNCDGDGVSTDLEIVVSKYDDLEEKTIIKFDNGWVIGVTETSTVRGLVQLLTTG